jgi:glycosyltransferase involved in cell wall biosynthesis
LKILFIARKFDGVAGGVEKQSIQLMNYLVTNGNEISLLTWDRKSPKSFYQMNDQIKWHVLDMGNAQVSASWLLRIKRQIKIRSIIGKINPNAIIAFQHGAFLAVRTAIIGKNIPIVAAERNAPQRFAYVSRGKFRQLIFLSFVMAAKIVVQFESYIIHYPKYLKNKIVTINNPVNKIQVKSTTKNSRRDRDVILFVGHLEFQKNPFALLEAFAMLAPRFPEWNLHFLGKGSLRKPLTNFIANHKLDERVVFRGLETNMSAIYGEADIFCAPSMWEGFPNALAEALAHSLPAVGFKECPGVNELIIHEENGLLADNNGDKDKLAGELRKLMQSDELRKTLGKRGPGSVAKYGEKDIQDQWEKVIGSVAK